MIGVTWFGYKGQHSTHNIVLLWLRGAGEVCFLFITGGWAGWMGAWGLVWFWGFTMQLKLSEDEVESNLDLAMPNILAQPSGQSLPR